MSGLRALGILLAVQIGLALMTWWPTDRSALVPHAFLDFEPAEITEIGIARRPVGGEEPSWLRLRREGERWSIASADDYPADTAKVDRLIEKLLGMRVKNPIGTHKTSHNALKVGEREYGRRVQIRTPESSRELIVGPASSNSLNVRFVEEDDVYRASGLSEFSLADTPSAYWASDYFHLPVDEIRSFTVENQTGTVSAERSEDGWSVSDVPEGRRADDAAIAAFLAKASTLKLVEPVGTKIEPAQGLGTGVRISFTLDSIDQSIAGGYEVGAIDGSTSFVKADTERFVVKVSTPNVADVRTVTAEDFLIGSPKASNEPND